MDKKVFLYTLQLFKIYANVRPMVKINKLINHIIADGLLIKDNIPLCTKP